jgi:DnaJ-class molecular chaperone
MHLARIFSVGVMLSCLQLCVPTLYDLFGLTRAATMADIKKVYRKLALELHPDKIPAETPDSEKEIMLNKFLAIQSAYEILSDEDSRLKYDLSEQGIQYAEREMPEKERYTAKFFSIFAQNKKIKLYFQAHFEKKKIPDVVMNVPIAIKDVYSGLKSTISFYRSVRCTACHGNGGLNGSCATCSFCDGAGHANHIHERDNRGYSHMTNTQCLACGGLGCKPNGTCPSCKGTGFVMEEAKLPYELPPGFPDGSTGFYEGRGHEDLDGTIGDVKVTFLYIYPLDWSRESPTSFNLIYEMTVPYLSAAKGIDTSINTLAGDTIKVL